MTDASPGSGTNGSAVASKRVMRILSLVLIALNCVPPMASQERRQPGSDDAALHRFQGTWKGVCADGKDFVVVILTQIEAGGLGGTVRLANMRGGDDGQCATVVDPPSEKHALAVTDAKLSGSTITFRGGKRTEFAMSLQNGMDAHLRFIGTASEDHPWKLRKAQ